MCRISRRGATELIENEQFPCHCDGKSNSSMLPTFSGMLDTRNIDRLRLMFNVYSALAWGFTENVLRSVYWSWLISSGTTIAGMQFDEVPCCSNLEYL